MHAEEDALERRIVTVLFADLVGFTPLSERLDAEDVAAIQDRYFALARETATRYGGRIEKFIGDAVMAVFGAARSRDDDVERAVRAGLALVSGVQQLNAQIGLDENVLQLRVGINTGEAVVAASGDNEGRVTGDTVNTAARFQSAARAGGVLIGESTALAVADVAELGDPLQLELKGKSEPTVARVVMGLRMEPSREQAMGALHAPTVGRERELAELQAAFERTSNGLVERWLVVAPPGVGKSRLLREIGDDAHSRSHAVTWRTRARPGAVSPFDAIAGLLNSALGQGGLKGLADLLARSGAPATRAAVVAESCASLLDPVTDGARVPTEERDALFAAWLDALDALSESATQLWLIEDIHWAGGDVLAFLDLAGSRPVPHGRLIVATARPSLLEARPEWAAESENARQRVLRLSTLAGGDARELVTALVGGALPSELVNRIVERSDGNCLFIEELLRTWVSVGSLRRSEDGWRLAVAADEIPMPHSVQQIYSAQLDDLPPDARRLARRASVAGRRFPVRALAALESGDAGLDPLRRRELVTGPVSEPLVGDSFAYRHALLRDAGYASLARAERARLHARLARWLEQAAGGRSAEIAEQIAGHYAAAVESAPALATNVDESLTRDKARAVAADWFERAGRTAFTFSAHEAARHLLRRSIDLTGEAASLDLGRRWQALGDATAFAADMAEGAADYERAVDVYRTALQAGRSEAAITGLAIAVASLADVWYQQLRFQEAHDLADATLAALPDADDGSRAELFIARGRGALGATGPGEEAEADLTRAVELAERTADERLKVNARSALVSLLSETGRATAPDWLDIARGAARTGDVRMQVVGLSNAAGDMVDDAPRNLHEALAQARALCVAHGRLEDSGWTDYIEAESLFASGDWDRALELAVKVMDLSEANAYLRLTVRIIHLVVPMASARGDISLLQRCQTWYDGIENKFEFPDSPYARVIRPAQDLELADAGLRRPYVPEIDSRIASFAENPSGPSWAAALDRVVRAWVESDELDGAQRAVDAMTTYMRTATGVSELGRGTFRLMTARVAIARGERTRGVESATDALANFRSSEAPWWMAKAIRLLERTDSLSPALSAEVETIEHGLRAIGPTR